MLVDVADLARLVPVGLILLEDFVYLVVRFVQVALHVFEERALRGYVAPPTADVALNAEDVEVLLF